jgi:DNA-directed RNA polymerase specialized sigma24 family protein
MEYSPIDLPRLKAGDGRAWSSAFPQLLAIAISVSKRYGAVLTREDAEDLAIQTLAVIPRRLEAIETVEQLRATVAAIAVNQAVSMVRRKFAGKRGGVENLVSSHVDDINQVPAPASELSEQELRDLILLLRSALDVLDVTTRALLVEKVVDGATFEVLSKKYHIPPGTLYPKLARALLRVRRSLEDSPVFLKELRDFLR